MERKRDGAKQGKDGSLPFGLPFEMPQLLYGPPEMFAPTRNEAAGLYGPPSMFNPSDNVTEDLYGPPSMLGLAYPDDVDGIDGIDEA